jgi:hypothetical protein
MADQQLRLVATQAQPEDLVDSHDEGRFGCVRFLVWAMLLDVALVIAGLLCWRLRVLPW